MSNFVPMAGPVRAVFDVLAALVDVEAECGHTHSKACADEKCSHGITAEVFGLEEAANKIVGMIERGELT